MSNTAEERQLQLAKGSQFSVYGDESEELNLPQSGSWDS